MKKKPSSSGDPMLRLIEAVGDLGWRIAIPDKEWSIVASVFTGDSDGVPGLVIGTPAYVDEVLRHFKSPKRGKK